MAWDSVLNGCAGIFLRSRAGGQGGPGGQNQLPHPNKTLVAMMDRVQTPRKSKRVAINYNLFYFLKVSNLNELPEKKNSKLKSIGKRKSSCFQQSFN